MDTTMEGAPVSKGAQRTGYAMSGLVVMFLLFDGAIKLVPLDIVTHTMQQLGYPADEGTHSGSSPGSVRSSMRSRAPPRSVRS